MTANKYVIQLSILFLYIGVQAFAQKTPTAENKRLEKQAQRVTIIRDNWGIAHV